MEIVFAAAVTGAFAIWAELIRRNQNKLSQKLQTNHGMEPWQYLEMILEVKQSQVDLHQALVDHTKQDHDNFAKLENRLREISDAQAQ